jgi:membrane protease YdiL (CAAX protease family)
VSVLGHYVASLRHFASRARRSPATGAFFALAAIAQWVVGAKFAGPLLAAGYVLLSFGFVTIAAAIVRHFCAAEAHAEPPPRAAMAQLVIVLVFVALMCAAFAAQLPALDNPVTRAVNAALAPIQRRAGAATNTLVYGLAPALVLAPFARSRSDFGLGRAPARLLAALVALYLPLLVANARLVPTAGAYLLVAAFPEEMLFRALLQTRLSALARDGLTRCVAASLIFGLMHLPINVARHGWIVGVAFCLGTNAFGGFFFGYVYERARSLLAVVVLHAVAGIATGGAG